MRFQMQLFRKVRFWQVDFAPFSLANGFLFISQIKKLHVDAIQIKELKLHVFQSLLRVVLLSALSCLSASKSGPAVCCPSSLHLPPKAKRFPSYQLPTAAANTDKGRPLKRSHLLILSQHCAPWANRLFSLICAAVDFRECHSETHDLEPETTVG